MLRIRMRLMFTHFMQRAVERLRQIPGVESATLVNWLPIGSLVIGNFEH